MLKEPLDPAPDETVRKRHPRVPFSFSSVAENRIPAAAVSTVKVVSIPRLVLGFDGSHQPVSWVRIYEDDPSNTENRVAKGLIAEPLAQVRYMFLHICLGQPPGCKAEPERGLILHGTSILRRIAGIFIASAIVLAPSQIASDRQPWHGQDCEQTISDPHMASKHPRTETQSRDFRYRPDEPVPIRHDPVISLRPDFEGSCCGPRKALSEPFADAGRYQAYFAHGQEKSACSAFIKASRTISGAPRRFSTQEDVQRVIPAAQDPVH